MSGMQSLKNRHKNKKIVFFSRDKKKKVVKNTTSRSVFSFFFSLQGKRLGHKTAQRNTTTLLQSLKMIS